MKDLPATGTPLMVLCCLYANDSHRHVPRCVFPAQTSIPDCLFDISTYTSNTHLKCDLFKTKLLIFSSKLVSLPPFSISGLSCHPFCCSGQLFQSHVDFFFFSLSYSTSTLSGNLMHSVPKIYPVSHPFWSPPWSESSCHHHLSPGPGSSLLTGLPASTIVPCHLFSNFSDIILPCSLCPLPRILVPIGCPVNLSCLCSDVTFSVRTSLTTLLKTAVCWPLLILLTLLYIFFLHGICHPLNTTYVTYYVYCFTSFPQPGCQLLEGWVLIYYIHWYIPSA